jgi:hypothetical protein
MRMLMQRLGLRLYVSSKTVANSVNLMFLPLRGRMPVRAKRQLDWGTSGARTDIAQRVQGRAGRARIRLGGRQKRVP